MVPGKHPQGTNLAVGSKGEGQGATRQLVNFTQEKFLAQERTKRIQQEGTGYWVAGLSKRLGLKENQDCP